MPFVIDNSIVCGWLFENQASDYGDAVAQRLLDDRAHAPVKLSQVLSLPIDVDR
jgi:hypothetical protein